MRCFEGMALGAWLLALLGGCALRRAPEPGTGASLPASPEEPQPVAEAEDEPVVDDPLPAEATAPRPGPEEVPEQPPPIPPDAKPSASSEGSIEAPPAPVSGESVISAPVVGAEGAMGIVEDLLFEPTSGMVLGIAVVGVGGRFVLDASLARWVVEPSGCRVLVDPAEAPAPRELDAAALFDAEQPEIVSGELREIELVGAGPERAAILTVHDDANLLHRVLLSAPHLVVHRLPGLELGAKIDLEGVLTRDASGKLWIASRVSVGEDSILLRDEAGSLLWELLANDLLSASALAGTSILTADHSAFEVVGWSLEPETRSIQLRILLDGSEQSVPWTPPGDGGQPTAR